MLRWNVTLMQPFSPYHETASNMEMNHRNNAGLKNMTLATLLDPGYKTFTAHRYECLSL